MLINLLRLCFYLHIVQFWTTKEYPLIILSTILFVRWTMFSWFLKLSLSDQPRLNDFILLPIIDRHNITDYINSFILYVIIRRKKLKTIINVNVIINEKLVTVNTVKHKPKNQKKKIIHYYRINLFRNNGTHWRWKHSCWNT